MTTERASTLDSGSESGFRKRAPVSYALRYRGRDIRLRDGVTTIGRDMSCDIVIASPLASRRHAKIVVSDDGVTAEDMGSRNGVLLHSNPINGVAELRVGDLIGIGDEVLELVEAPPLPEPRDNVTLMDMRAVREPLPTEDDLVSATRHADAFQLLGGVVDKALALGRGEEAERLLMTHLKSALAQARRGIQLPAELCVAASTYALKLASATKKPFWMNFPIELYDALGAILPIPIIDELYKELRRVRGMDRVLLGHYLDGVKARPDLNPTERFAVQRIEGLYRLTGL